MTDKLIALNDDAQTLINLLHRGGNYSFFQRINGDDKCSYWRKYGKLIEFPADIIENYNFFFGVNPATMKITDEDRKKYPDIPADRIATFVGTKNSTIAALNCLYSEFDGKDYTFPSDEEIEQIFQALRANPNKASANDATLRLEATGMAKEAKYATDPQYYRSLALEHVQGLATQPSAVVDSGGGYQAYWLTAETFVLHTDADRERAASLQKRWVMFVCGDPSVHDLRRILRVPGSRNHKKRYAPDYPVIDFIKKDFDLRYSWDELEALLPPEEPKPLPQRINGTYHTNGEGSFIDIFNASNSIADVLLAHGYTWAGKDRMNRPGSEDSKGVVIYANDNESYHHSGGDPLHNGYRMKPFNVVCKLDYNDDPKEAIRALRPEPIKVNHVTQTKIEAPADEVEPTVETPTEELTADKIRERRKLTYPYEVCNGCIGEWRERKVGKGETEDYFQPLCNFNAWIVADVAADDGEEISRKIAIAGRLANGAPLPEIEIPADEFEAMKWPVAQWGARISIEPLKNANNLLRAAIQRLSTNMQDRRTLTHTGWTIVNGERLFLHAGGAIGSNDVSVKLPRNLNNYRFPIDDAVDPVTAMRESIKLLDVAPARVAMPIWAAMFLGPLSEIIAPVFTVNVEGGSGSLKSSYSAVMLNHYGAKFHEYAMPADWLATPNTLEKLCFHAKDVTLIIDDYRPSTDANENKKLSAAVSHIVRAVGNRQGRGRLDQNAEFRREYIPRGVVLMTAEKKAVGKSTLSRIITVDVEPGDIDSKMLAQCQKQRHIYAYAMRDFIRYVTREWEHLNQVLPAQVAEIRAAAAMYGHHRRLPNATSILFVAFNCAMAYAVEIGAITQSAADQYMMHFYEALKDLAELQNEATENEDPGKRYLITVASLIAQGKAHIGVKPGNESLIPLGNRNAERLGWHDGESVFFLPGAYHAVCKYASAEGQMFPSDEVTLRKELDRGGWIVKKTDGRLTTKQRQPGGSVINVLAVALDRFAEVLESLGVDL